MQVETDKSGDFTPFNYFLAGVASLFPPDATDESGDFVHPCHYFLAGVATLFPPDRTPAVVLRDVELRFGPHPFTGSMSGWGLSAQFAGDDKHPIDPNKILIERTSGTFTAIVKDYVVVFRPNLNQLHKWRALYKHTEHMCLKEQVGLAYFTLRHRQLQLNKHV